MSVEDGRVRRAISHATIDALGDGSFSMVLDGERVHVPRRLALRHYPELEGAHDVAFGEGKWGRYQPLTFDTAPIGKTPIIADTLEHERSIDELIGFYIVLAELGAALKPAMKEQQRIADLEGFKLRKNAERRFFNATEDAGERHKAMAWIVADTLVQVRTAFDRIKERSQQLIELCATTSIPVPH